MVTSIYLVVLGGLAEVSVLQIEVSVKTVRLLSFHLPSAELPKVNCTSAQSERAGSRALERPMAVYTIKAVSHKVHF